MSNRPPSALASTWRIRQVAGDFLFKITTCRLTAAAIETMGLHEAFEPLLDQGWTIRCAGPRWFIIWSRNDDRLLRHLTLILPEPWVGLTSAERVTVLAAQLQQLGLASPDLSALGATNRKIWIKLAGMSHYG